MHLRVWDPSFPGLRRRPGLGVWEWVSLPAGGKSYGSGEGRGVGGWEVFLVLEESVGGVVLVGADRVVRLCGGSNQRKSGKQSASLSVLPHSSAHSLCPPPPTLTTALLLFDHSSTPARLLPPCFPGFGPSARFSSQSC